MIEVFSQNIDGVWFGVACVKQQILVSSFGSNQKETLRNILNALPFNSAFQIFHEPSAYAKTTMANLKGIYDGKSGDAKFSLTYTHLPPYTQKVLKATAQIPVGYVTSYGLIAKAVGGGARAVGNIMASNPFAPIVPCHRVVKSDFKLGGYGLGLKVKVEILQREKRGYCDSKEIRFNGGSFTVFPTEYVLRNLSAF